MSDLPINAVLEQIKTTLKKNNRVVLQAPPGAGKTTAVPITLLNQPWLNNKQIIMLEPRRLAARNAAARMAYLLNEKVGETVGYQIRQDKCVSDKTKILVVTEGILTRKLQVDPELNNTALIIFDEFHERSIHADLSLALCLQSQQVLREDLKLLVMSATLNTMEISGLLDNAPVIQSEGRSFPVDIKYIEKPVSIFGASLNKTQQLILQILGVLKTLIKEQQRSCLVFLPGVKEIAQLQIKLQQYIKSENIENVLLAPLHGSLNKKQQDKAICAPEKNTMKIVLSTNIAETSLTIEGIDCVIDSGLERILEYSPATAMNTLVTRSISQDSATQRSGRAGRLSAGVCYRLWTPQQQQRLQKHSIAEILHSDLSSFVLELANWGVQQVDELQWSDHPPESSVNQAKSLLFELSAIDNQGKVTQHGRQMLRLGTHPRLAHMMLSARALNQTYHACLMASILSEKDIFKSQAIKSADLSDRLKILAEPSSLNTKKSDVDVQQCKRVLQTANDFFGRLMHNHMSPNKNQKNIDNEFSGVLLAYAYPDRIARQRKKDQCSYLLRNGKGAVVPDYLQHNLYKYIVIANLDAKLSKGEAKIYLMAETSLPQLSEYFPQLIEKKQILQWNDKQCRVDAKTLETLGEIVFREKISTAVDIKEVHEILISGIRKTGLECLNWTPQIVNLVNRVNFIRLHDNAEKISDIGDINLPDFSDAALLDSLENWLLPYLTNEMTIKQCLKLNLFSIFDGLLSWKQKQLIDNLAPLKIKVPSGSNVAIDYSDITQPVLAVRLQEVFGLYDTPCILNGNYTLMMHLLSPARRPMQITQDLNSFWKTTYHDVKKELRGKYKRHYWPDDPFTAKATSKTKKNM